MVFDSGNTLHHAKRDLRSAHRRQLLLVGQLSQNGRKSLHDFQSTSWFVKSLFLLFIRHYLDLWCHITGSMLRLK
jgi:hypothetical protein